MKTITKNTSLGFTLIELLIVVSVIGILSGVLVNVINGDYQKKNAEDSVKRKNINDLAVAIETYRAAEGAYPAEGTANNPLDVSATTRDVAAVYISQWPTGVIYNFNGTNFWIYVQKSTTTDIIKYTSTWKELRECAASTPPGNINACN